ncbi:unnamed protein product [Oppiella nova]|uniref:Uncharacterized protein n=1 Tax=Oppiella nova TaxID=334625 RepID=A0A7R9M9P6_9ACAR|nr:unnamed protein product [Oppiella nova]CAG2173405.1 unnamed protein product [Oppiella nova]
MAQDEKDENGNKGDNNNKGNGRRIVTHMNVNTSRTNKMIFSNNGGQGVGGGKVLALNQNKDAVKEFREYKKNLAKARADRRKGK